MYFPLIKLKDILTESKDEAPSPNVSKRIRVRLHSKGVEKRPEMNDKEGATKYYIRRAGQFVYGRQNLHKGAFGVIPPELDGFQSSSDIPSFDVDDRCLPEWIDLFLKQGSYYLELSKLASGVGSQRISPSKFLSLEIPLPSVAQQRKILRQVEVCSVLQERLSFELNDQQTTVNKLRQQILREAIEGKLTIDWRAQNPDTVPANELLKRIVAEKAKLAKEKKLKAQKPLPLIKDDEKPFELPQGWEWARVGEITSVVTSGSRNWQSLYSSSGATFIRSQDIKLDKLHYANRAFVDVSKAKEGTRTLVNQHDWLIIITGANVGKCAYLDKPIEEAYVSQHVGLMRPVLKDMGIFGHYWFMADLGGRGLLSKFIYGDKPGLNLPQLRNLLIPIPPLDEQSAIVVKVEALLALCDQLETQVAQNQTYAEKLIQALLKEAFNNNRASEPSVTSRATAYTPEGADA